MVGVSAETPDPSTEHRKQRTKAPRHARGVCFLRIAQNLNIIAALIKGCDVMWSVVGGFLTGEKNTPKIDRARSVADEASPEGAGL